MGLLARLERRSLQPLGHPRDPALVEWFGGARSITGASVTPESALTLMAIFRAVRLLANTMATLPIGVYERTAKGTLKPAYDHPLTTLLTRRPNRWQTAFGWKQMMGGHLELRGNAFAEILTDKKGRITDLVPRHPDRIFLRAGVLTPELGEIVWYEHYPLNGPRRIILWDEMLHLRGFSQDGLMGLSPITVARETIGLALSNREYAARYLANNSQPGGALIHPKGLSKLAKENLRESWQRQHGAVHNVGSVAILEEDMKWQSIGFNPKDSQFLEQRSFDNVEIARMFDLPPHKLMDLDRSTNNNIEHQGIEYVMDAILPRSVNLEETLERDLLLPSEEDRFFIECNLEGLLRGDSVSRGTFYNSLFQVGAFTPNDIRRKENHDPVPGGDESFIPLNMVPLSQAAQVLDPVTTDPTTTPQQGRALALRRRITRAHERLFTETIGRVLRKEAQAGRRALAQAVTAGGIAPVESWLTEFYRDHEGFVVRSLEPVVQTAGEAIGLAVCDEVRMTVPDDGTIPGLAAALTEANADAAHAHCTASRAAVRHVLKTVAAEGRAQALTALFDAWESSRALTDGAHASRLVSLTASTFLYHAAGVTPLAPSGEPQ